MRAKENVKLTNERADCILQEVLRECGLEPSSLKKAQKRIEQHRKRDVLMRILFWR